jgi:mannonate dehydratase
MRITDAKVIICSPGRNFVTLKLITEDGLYGLGDATLNGRELAAASYLTDHVIPSLIGRDARKIEDRWQYFYKGAYWRRGPVTMSAISAVDTALWDIKAKSLNAPLYQLLGGASRDAVLVYGHASGADIEDTVTAVAHYLKLARNRESRDSRARVGRGQMHYEPAEKGLPPGNHCSSEKYLNLCRSLLRGCARSLGPTCICCTTCIIG